MNVHYTTICMNATCTYVPTIVDHTYMLASYTPTIVGTAYPAYTSNAPSIIIYYDNVCILLHVDYILLVFMSSRTALYYNNDHT